MTSTWLSENEIHRAEGLIGLAWLIRDEGETARAAIERAAALLTAHLTEAWERQYPQWAEDSIKLSSAIDAGDLPAAVANAYYRRNADPGIALMALDAVGGDDLSAAFAAVATLPEPDLSDAVPGIDMAAVAAATQPASADGRDAADLRALAADLRALAAEPFGQMAARLQLQRTHALVTAAGEQETRDRIVRNAEQFALNVLLERATLAEAQNAIAQQLTSWAWRLEVAAQPQRGGDA